MTLKIMIIIIKFLMKPYIQHILLHLKNLIHNEMYNLMKRVYEQKKIKNKI